MRRTVEIRAAVMPRTFCQAVKAIVAPAIATSAPESPASPQNAAR